MIDRHKTRIKKVLEENHVASPVWQLGDSVLSIIEEQQAQIQALEATVKQQQDNIEDMRKDILSLTADRTSNVITQHWPFS